MAKTIIAGIFFYLMQHSVALAQNYINYYLIHTGVDNTLRENERQTDIRNGQVIVNSLDVANNEQTTRLQKVAKKIQGRTNSLGLILDGTFMATTAIPIVNQIYSTQSNLIALCQDYPHLMPTVIAHEARIVSQVTSLSRYMTGIILSIGPLNQMTPDNRRILLSHALTELREINRESWRAITTIRTAIRTEEVNRRKMRNWVNREKDMIERIIRNAKNL